MAKVTITLEDDGEGYCGGRFEFDPPMRADEEGDVVDPTPAQTAALAISRLLREEGKGRLRRVGTVTGDGDRIDYDGPAWFDEDEDGEGDDGG